jgi:hypothetical protein
LGKKLQGKNVVVVCVLALVVKRKRLGLRLGFGGRREEKKKEPKLKNPGDG